VPDRWKEVDGLGVHVEELNLAARHQQATESLPYPQFLLGYLTGLAGTVGLAVGGKLAFGIDPFATGFLTIGVLYLLAAAQRPRIVYLILRNVSWFGSIRNIPLLRGIMFVLGIVLLALGVFFQFRWLASGTWL
jgi:hypothetical protein